MENATRSIIYGTPQQNRYEGISNVIDYIKETQHFKRYNRFAYAFRVDEAGTVFVTEKRPAQTHRYEGCHSDVTIEGSGEKLLHLLNKFNIKNVFIGVLVQQFNPLAPFQTTNYRMVVENSRLLLEQLYRKVAEMEDQSQQHSQDQQAPVIAKTFNMAQNAEIPQQLRSEPRIRPNHVFSKEKPKFLKQAPKKTNDSTYEIKFLWGRCKNMKEQFTELQNSLDEKEIAQLQYYALYDKSEAISQTMRLLALHEDVERSALVNYDFKAVTQFKCEPLPQQTLQRLDQALKSAPKAPTESLIKTNRPVGVLFFLIDLRVRFSKVLKRISQLMDAMKQANSS